MGEWPLTGRDAEMDLLASLLGGDVSPTSVVIAGGAGVGKTRLGREAADAAAQRGWVVRSVQGTAAAQAIPLGTFLPWISQFDEQPLSLVSSVIAAVTTSPDNAPVLLVVDDVHLLDDLSAFVLHQLVRGQKATVIATLRTDEPAPKAITELWKDGHLQRLDLQPLSREAFGTLLKSALGGSVDDQSASRMWELTRGNVLFMRELIRQEVQAGRLVQSDEDHWVWTGSITVSPSLADLVDSYIGTASESVLDVMDLVAFAEPLELNYLGALADPQDIEDAESLGLIQVSHESPTDLVRIGHPLYGEIRRSRVGRVKARRLCGRVAEAMRSPAVGAAPVDQVRLALLLLESDLPGDADVHHQGAAAAFRRLDLALSERLADAAIRAGDNRPGIESQILQARSLSMVGRGEEAEQLLTALPKGGHTDDARVAATILRALNLLLTQGKPEQSWTVIDEALTDTAAPLNQELLAFRALQLAMAARPAEVVALLDSIESDGLTADSRINLNYGTTIAFGELGRITEATQTPEDKLVLGAESSANAFQAISLAQIHVDALATDGNIPEAMNLGTQVVEQWTDLPTVPQTIAAALTGLAAVAQGDLLTARETLGPALATDVLRQDPTGLPLHGIGYWLNISFTEALARAGDGESAATALSETERNRHPSFTFLEPNRMLAAAWVAAARGRISEAVNLANQAADFARTHGQYAREVLSLQTAIQFGDNGHEARLRELADLIDGPRARIALRWCRAQESHDGDSLLEVSSDLESMGDRIAAADAAAHAAQAFHRQNLRGSKLTASGRAARIISECGASTPATRDISMPLPLSKREREIATLVRDGMSNKDIAEALTMSVRTVEGHIYRACNKLDVANRTELAELIKQFNPE
ncbi:MAG: LuxR C-terminal-related transcriptional regulator [Candidatus Nanopelagicales bacterium]